MFGPVIRGKLVVLRPPKQEEPATIVTWFLDLEVTRFVKLRFPPSVGQEMEFLDNMARDAGSVFWVVEHDGNLVGVTSIRGIDWKHGFGTTGTVIGDKKAWGKGLARELMRLRADFAFTQLPLRSLRSGYVEGNEASRRAQLSAGYKEVGRWHRERFVDGRWCDHVLTELLREEWEARRSV
jgi:RimJ/RimL family protein N-acetyltransferase